MATTSHDLDTDTDTVPERPAKKARLDLGPPIPTDRPSPRSADTPVDDMDDAAFYADSPLTPAVQQDDQLHPADSAPRPNPLRLPEHSQLGIIPGLRLISGHDQEPLEVPNQLLETEDIGLSRKAEDDQLETKDVSQAIGLKNESVREAKDHSTAIGSNGINQELPENLEPGNANEDPEWQFDSSDAPSTSTDDSSDSDTESSDSGESAGDDDYELLGPEEQARILMQDGGDSDAEEGGGKKGGSTSQPRTKNEVLEVEKVELPNIKVTEDTKIKDLGQVNMVVDNTVLIRANVSGEYQVLDQGSVLCLEDKTIFGVVAETLGRVQQPIYSVRFNSSTEIDGHGITIGTKVSYIEPHSTFVFTQQLRAVKGSDASNLHDEEIGEEEQEFSDDEAEAEHKRRVKLEKSANRDRSDRPNGSKSRRGRGGMHHGQRGSQAGIDVGDGENLYTPLARPDNFQDMISRSGEPMELPRSYETHDSSRGWDHRGSREFKSRGRGGRGDRRNSWRGNHSRNDSDSPSQRGHQSQASPSFSPQPPPHALPTKPQIPPPQQQLQFQSPYPVMGYPQSPYGMPFNPMFPSQFTFGSSNQQQPYVPHSPSSLASPLPSGAFVNPAFFRNQQHVPTTNGPSVPTGVWNQPATSPTNFGQYQQSPLGSRGMSPEAEAAARAAQEKLDILERLSGGH